MIGDVEDIDLEIGLKKAKDKQKKDFLSLFNELEKERVLCEKIHEEYGKIIKISRIYVKRKGSKNAYYKVTYEADKQCR